MLTSVMFLLPVGGGSGGAHSVMQEADAMWSLGVSVSILANQSNALKLRQAYKDLTIINKHIIGYENGAELGEILLRAKPDVVVATTNQSVHTLAEVLPKTQRSAYYVQDYEPLFYEPSSEEWRTAYKSYGLIPNMVHFAKTRWLQEVVEANHGVQVAKVQPSVDHKVYYPDFRNWLSEPNGVSIVAMLRPSTPRRAPRRTIRILNQIANEFSGRARVFTFGCRDQELSGAGLKLDSKITHLGVLRREEVGDLFRTTDVFLDLSDFQAFGRTAIEAMSCGTLAIVPAHGGVYEFAVDGKNAFIVDVRYDHLILKAIASAMAMNTAERQEMRLAAVAAGFAFSPERAALSEIQVLV